MIPDFIETYDTLTKEQCDSIIDWFEEQTIESRMELLDLVLSTNR